MLLMLALPLQGMASASMLGCLAGGAEHVSPEAEAPAMAGCHEQEPPDAPPAQHDCQHCAACVLATALPIPVGEVATVTAIPIRYFSHPAAAFSGFIPDGPERPPRLSFA